MPCNGRCFALTGVQGTPVNHEEAAQNGFTWYFCPAHRCFHALFLFAGAPQPLCGECAVLFFDRAHHAVWMRQYDLEALMSNSFAVVDEARADFEALLLEIDLARSEGRTVESLSPLHHVSPDILAEIPTQDSTYAALSTRLIPHKRIPGLSLLEYRTFQGATAYQPCSKDIDTCGIFDSLWPIEQYGDPIFKQARAWSCIIQASPALPKELRWVLATMYNFCNEMLRPENDEQALWLMRPWLMHWYNVAEQLLDGFFIFASTPEVDWFARPLSRARSDEATTLSQSDQATAQRASESSTGTVIRHQPNSSVEGPWISHGPIGGRVDAIQAWLAQQPSFRDADETRLFDPTPSGYVSPRARCSVPSDRPPTNSGNGRSVSSWSRLDPRAAIFDPRKEQASLPSRTEKDSMRRSDQGTTTGEDSDMLTEPSECSCLHSSHCPMLPHAGYRVPSLGSGLVAAAWRQLNPGLG